jgi:RNA polymerase sigma factor (sigma-70 family)
MSMNEKFKELSIEGVPTMHNKEILKTCLTDSGVMDEFLRQSKDFIFNIVGYYKGNIETLKEKFNVEEEEILQHGRIAIFNSLKTFDPSRGIKFTTYAVRPIIWEINQLLYSQSQLIKLSRKALETLKKIKAIEEKEGVMRVEEIAKTLGIPNDRIADIMSAVTSIKSIDDYNYNELSDKYLIEDDLIDKLYLKEALKEINLIDIEKRVIEEIKKGFNNAQIAEKLGVYPMTIHRTINKIRQKILRNEKVNSKYKKEIDLITEEIEERGGVISIEDVKDVLELCEMGEYSQRILYYIRTKALMKYKDKGDIK